MKHFYGHRLVTHRNLVARAKFSGNTERSHMQKTVHNTYRYPGPKGFLRFFSSRDFSSHERAAREPRSGEHESRSNQKGKVLVTLACSRRRSRLSVSCQWRIGKAGRRRVGSGREKGEIRIPPSPFLSLGSRSLLIPLVAHSLFRSSSLTESLEQAMVTLDLNLTFT